MVFLIQSHRLVLFPEDSYSYGPKDSTRAVLAGLFYPSCQKWVVIAHEKQRHLQTLLASNRLFRTTKRMLDKLLLLKIHKLNIYSSDLWDSFSFVSTPGRNCKWFHSSNELPNYCRTEHKKEFLDSLLSTPSPLNFMAKQLLSSP